MEIAGNVTWKVKALSLAEYASAGVRGRRDIVAGHIRTYESEEFYGGRTFYSPARSAIRAAVNSTDPVAEFDDRTARCTRLGQERAMVAVRDGFLRWFTGIRATGVPVGKAEARVGDLSLTINPDIGLRLRDGTLLAVLVHLKETPVTKDGAVVALRLLARHVDEILPGARPVLVDARAGRAVRLPRCKPSNMDAYIEAEAASYSTLWRGLRRTA